MMGEGAGVTEGGRRDGRVGAGMAGEGAGVTERGARGWREGAQE